MLSGVKLILIYNEYQTHYNIYKKYNYILSKYKFNLISKKSQVSKVNNNNDYKKYYLY